MELSNNCDLEFDSSKNYKAELLLKTVPLSMQVCVEGKPTSQKFSGVEGGMYRKRCREQDVSFFLLSSSGRSA